jgi:hypothetical protein
MPRTLEEIRKEELAALRQRLGRSGMIRFLQQFEKGQGDYAHHRHAWVDCMSLADIRELAGRKVKGKNRRSR